MSIYGELDTANESLKRVVMQLGTEWVEGKTRYRKEDIERARKYLKEIGKSSKMVRDTLNQFDSIVLSNPSVIMKSLANKKNK